MCAALVVALLASSTTAADAATLIRAGDRCPSVGKVQIVKQVRLVCTRVKGKPVWVAKRAPVPTPTPTRLPTVEERWGGQRWYAQAADISRLSRTVPRVEFTNRLVSPNFDISLIAPLLEYQSLASSYWASVGFEVERPIQVVFLTEKDRAWYDTNVRIVAQSVNSFFDVNSPNYFNGTVIVPRIPAESFTIVYFVGTMFKRHTSDWQWKLATMATHEYQHLVQYESTLTTSGVNLQNKLPCWFGEGFAAFYEDSFYFQNASTDLKLTSLQSNVKTDEWFVNQRNSRMQNLRQVIGAYDSSTSVASWNTEQWVRFIADNYRNDSVGCSQIRYGYLLGRILTEKLQADFGSLKILELLQEYKRKREWDLAFTEVFDVSEHVWLRENAVPYLLEQQFWS